MGKFTQLIDAYMDVYLYMHAYLNLLILNNFSSWLRGFASRPSEGLHGLAGRNCIHMSGVGVTFTACRDRGGDC